MGLGCRGKMAETIVMSPVSLKAASLLVRCWAPQVQRFPTQVSSFFISLNSEPVQQPQAPNPKPLKPQH